MFLDKYFTVGVTFNKNHIHSQHYQSNKTQQLNHWFPFTIRLSFHHLKIQEK